VNCRYTDCALVALWTHFILTTNAGDSSGNLHRCDACVPECPVEAVFAEDKLPAEWASYTQINAERALSGLPTINVRLESFMPVNWEPRLPVQKGRGRSQTKAAVAPS